MNTKEYSVTVVSDDEKFTSSKCKCLSCKKMHISQVEWDAFTPRTNLERRMKEVIARIEARESDKIKQ